MSERNEREVSRRALREARLGAAREQAQDAPDMQDASNVEDAPATATAAAPDTSGSAGPRSRRAAAAQHSRRAASEPVDAPAPRAAERVSLARARDREALRAYRALADQKAAEQKAAEAETGPVPTRRQLRIQQQQTAAAELSAMQPDALEAGLGNAGPGEPKPAAPRPAAPPQEEAAQDDASAAGSLRRDRRRRSSEAGSLEVGPAPSLGDLPGPAPSAGPENRVDAPDMTVEQALAAREAIAGQARNQVAMMEAAQKDDPFSVDLELLAQQKALAERAAILNTRAQKIQELSERNREQRSHAQHDPTTAHNLSIVSPLEYVQVPGVGRPALKAPSTSHIPIQTSPVRTRSALASPALANSVQSSPAARPGATALGAVAPAVMPTAPDAGPVVSMPDAGPDVTGGKAESGTQPAGRSRVFAQAEAVLRGAGAGPVAPGGDGLVPVHADSAYGLDPLDAMTAGLARVRRMRYLEYSIVGVGALALMTGLMMIVGVIGG